VAALVLQPASKRGKRNAQKNCLAIDLRDDAEAIAEYERLHEPGAVWPEVIADLRSNGYEEMTIWRTGNRLIMIADIEPTRHQPKIPLFSPLSTDGRPTASLMQRCPGPGPGAMDRDEVCIRFEFAPPSASVVEKVQLGSAWKTDRDHADK